MKKINKNINSLIVFILFSLSYYLFFLSLEKCFEGEDLCCTKLKWIERKVIEEILSCLLITISLAIIIKKKLSKLHLIHLIIVFLSFYTYSHGNVFEDHGYYNIKYFLIIILPICGLLLIINFLLSIKNKKVSFLLFFFF